MKPGERIKEFRKNKGFTQKEFAEKLGYSQVFLSAIEIGKVEPSREFLKKLNEIFGISSDYILYSGTAAQWEKIEEKLKLKGFTEQEVREIHPDYLKALYLTGREEWQRGERHNLAVHEPGAKYQALPTSTKNSLKMWKRF